MMFECGSPVSSPKKSGVQIKPKLPRVCRCNYNPTPLCYREYWVVDCEFIPMCDGISQCPRKPKQVWPLQRVVPMIQPQCITVSLVPFQEEGTDQTSNEPLKAHVREISIALVVRGGALRCEAIGCYFRGPFILRGLMHEIKGME